MRLRTFDGGGNIAQKWRGVSDTARQFFSALPPISKINRLTDTRPPDAYSIAKSAPLRERILPVEVLPPKELMRRQKLTGE